MIQYIRLPLRDRQVKFIGGIRHPFSRHDNGYFPFGVREKGRVEDHLFDGHCSENNY